MKKILQKFCQKIDAITIITNVKKEEAREHLQRIIEIHCKQNNIDFDTQNLILIYPNSNPLPDQYFMYLTYSLCSKNEYEIAEYLSYHFNNYPYHPQDFLGRIINYVIDQTQRIMPIDNYSTREKIMEWVMIKKSQLNTLTNDNLLISSIQKKSIDTIVSSNESIEIKELYYWKKDIAKLENLYQILIEEKMIEPNENFIKSFSEFNVLHKYSTIWNNGETSLFALLYLLYDKQRTYNDINKETLAVISNKLFIIKGKKTNAKNTYQNFTNFLNKTDSADYFPKKHKDILAIYQKI